MSDTTPLEIGLNAFLEMACPGQQRHIDFWSIVSQEIITN